MSFDLILLVVLICYWALSIFFLFFPFQKRKFIYKNPIYQKLLQTHQKSILDIAHRGGSQESFENTINTFRHAKQLGINVLEMDVHLTKDKKLVVIHDTQLDRLCGVKGVVSDYNFATFPKYLNEIKLHFSPNGTVKNNQTDGDKICLLEDVFKQFPDSLFNIELKDASDDGIMAFYETVTKNHIDDQIVANLIDLGNKTFARCNTTQKTCTTYTSFFFS